MWQELIWNIDFGRQLIVGLIFLVLALLAAVYVVPTILSRWQRRRDVDTVKRLLRRWGNTCVFAVWRLNPIGNKAIPIEGYNFTTESGGYSSYQPLSLFWRDIETGKRKPDDAAEVLDEAIRKVMYSENERTTPNPSPDPHYMLGRGDLEVSKTMLRTILNPMYAKFEIFDLNLLPVDELETAMSTLEQVERLGYVTRFEFQVYAAHLNRSIERFGKYLWKLEHRYRPS